MTYIKINQIKENAHLKNAKLCDFLYSRIDYLYIL